MSEIYRRNRKILKTLEQGGLVLAPHKRHIQRLRPLHEASLGDLGIGVSFEEAFQPFEDWAWSCVSRLARPGHRPLTTQQYLNIWESIIEEDVRAASGNLLSLLPMAKKAFEAHLFATEAFGQEVPAHLFDSQDNQAFLRWREKFLQRCQESGFADPARIVPLTCEAIEKGNLELPERVMFYGFDKVFPTRITRARAALRQAGVKVVTEWAGRIKNEEQEIVRKPCLNPEEEVRFAARWARQKLSEKPRDVVGVLVCDLAETGPAVERALKEEFSPGSYLLPSEEEGIIPFIPKPLEKAPVAVIALEILEVQSRITADKAGLLLRSPYLRGYEQEQYSRAVLDREVRLIGKKYLDLDYLQDLAFSGVSKGVGCSPEFGKVLEALDGGEEWSARHCPSDWVLLFKKRLIAVGWAEKVRTFECLEYRECQAWDDVLQSMAALDVTSAELSHDDAVFLLRRLVSEVSCYPATRTKNLMVMSVEEATGQAFDHLWVLGLREGVYPAVAPINTLIPVALQKKVGAFKDEFAHARRAWRRLLGSTQSVVVSHPRVVKDCAYRPSSFISSVPEGEPALAAPNRPISYFEQDASVLESCLDDSLEIEAARRAVGGTSIFKDQANCPFRAFARHRLRAKGLESPDLGLDSPMRGNLVHYSLEMFWQNIKTSQALKALSPEALLAKVQECVQGGLADWEVRQRIVLSERFRAIEAWRLTKLLLEWLEMEKGRPLDFEVTQIEAKRRVAFGPMTIEVRVDRIDTLSDGRLVVIDYKTGRPSLTGWFGERLSEPQIPIYSLTEAGENLSALAFAQVRRGDCKFVGLSREEEILPGVSSVERARQTRAEEITSWSELTAYWQASLESLRQQFHEGMAIVDPIDIKKTCSYCDLSLFCRVAEQQLFVKEAGGDI